MNGFDRIRKSMAIAEELALKSGKPVRKGDAEPISEAEFIKSMGSLAAVKRSGRKDYIGLELLSQYSGGRRVKIVDNDGKRVVEFLSYNYVVLRAPVTKKVNQHRLRIKFWLTGACDVKALERAFQLRV